MQAPHRTYLTAVPWVSMTYIFNDDELEALGLGIVVMACHRCGASLVNTYVEDNVRDDVAKAMRDGFGKIHHVCQPAEHEEAKGDE